MLVLAKGATAKNGRIAGEKEVLEYLSGLLRGDITEKGKAKDGKMAEIEPGLRERLRAAELLGKRCGAFEAKERAEESPEAFTVEIKVVE